MPAFLAMMALCRPSCPLTSTPRGTPLITSVSYPPSGVYSKGMPSPTPASRTGKSETSKNIGFILFISNLPLFFRGEVLNVPKPCSTCFSKVSLYLGDVVSCKNSSGDIIVTHPLPTLSTTVFA